ncbi:MAG: Gfo/Idh/MocA family oxidoreductase [Candidatus Methanomethylicia archaeon]
MINELRIGIVGYDHLQEKIINALSRYTFVKVVGATEIAKDNEKAIYDKGVLIYKDLDSLIENEDPNILSVCSILETRYRIVKNAIDSKLNVMFEEPLTLNTNEIYDFKKILNNIDNILVVPINDIYYHPVLLDMLSYIYENEIGLPVSINFKRSVWIKENIDLLYLLTGAIHFARKVFNSEAIEVHSSTTLDKNYSVINLSFKNNTIANINLSVSHIINDENKRDDVFIDVIGTDGIIISRPSENIVFLQTKNKIERVPWLENNISNFIKLFIESLLGNREYKTKLLNIMDEMRLIETIELLTKSKNTI